ncbi:ladderlectin-like [Centropristis striata]|uniref:ladderlectin-like n=1 Tax=Centropristis striata TaxID=184440 RepID=UPI0027DFF0BD|nr:ladderlectin-like [Centropristis striata]XP_059210793.1 ladderlectin-like [Centropristis striata]
MKMLAVSALLCVTVALTRAAVVPEAEASKDLSVKSHLVKRSTSCSGRWTNINGRCFHYFPAPMTWAKAERNCQSMGGNLASVHDVQEYHGVQSLIKTATYQSKEAWIGASDAQEEGVWLWTDGSRFSYTNWCPGEPNNWRGRQHCIQINFGADKCWDDVGCGASRPFVCSKKM